MFFHDDLVKNKRFRNVWRAAHNQKADTNDVNIPKVCDSISKLIDDYSDNKLRHLSFRTAYTLFLGTVKTYKEQVDQLSKDAFDLAFEMEFGKPNVDATGGTSNSFQTDSRSNEADSTDDQETSINIDDTDDNEEEMDGSTRAESEEYFDPGETETSINIGDSDDNEEEMDGNTRAESKSSAETRISVVTRQLSPIIGLLRTTLDNQTAKDMRSPRKRTSDDEQCRGEVSSNITTRTHRPKVMKTSQEVQTNRSFIKNQKLKALYRRTDPVFDSDLPLAHTIIYAAGSRRPVKTIWSNVNPDVMKL